MLVLTRKHGEEIVIGTPPLQIIVKIVRISFDHVRVGIDAPRHIPVHRGEVAQRIYKERGRRSL